MNSQFIDGRVVGGCSLHNEEKPGCEEHYWRCVDCCNFSGEGGDILEFYYCGKQIVRSCTFDDDYS